MNFIVGFLLYHSEEYISFWLFVSLIEDYELRENYSTGRIVIQVDLPGLEKHADVITRLIKINNPIVHNIFVLHSVEIKIFISEWLFSLFGSVIPLELQVRLSSLIGFLFMKDFLWKAGNFSINFASN